MIKSYHYHITVQATADELTKLCKILKAKATTIDIVTSKSVRKDRMITKYSATELGISSELSNDLHILSSIGFNVTRYKIEAVTDIITRCTRQSIKNNMYTEVHIKVKDTSKRIPNLKLSTNSIDGARFYNGRARSIIGISKLIRAISEIDKDNIINSQYELVLLDSNINQDNNWR